MNHYPRHVGDYLRDTVGLTMLEEGAYTRLLDQYYSREGPLPADKAVLYRIARASTFPERKAVDAILAAYFSLTPGGWRQKRADMELQAQSERSASARESAKARWEKTHQADDANAYANGHANAGADAMPSDMQTHSEGNADSMLASSQKPVTSKPKAVQKPVSPRQTEGTRMTVDWRIPEEWIAWTLEAYPTVDRARVIRLSLEFRDFWAGVPGRYGLKTNWLATWRNNCRKKLDG